MVSPKVGWTTRKETGAVTSSATRVSGSSHRTRRRTVLPTRRSVSIMGRGYPLTERQPSAHPYPAGTSGGHGRLPQEPGAHGDTADPTDRGLDRAVVLRPRLQD